MYVVTADCSDPSHSFVSAIATAPSTTLPKESTGLRRRLEDLRILVRSYVDRLPPDAVFSHRSALIVHGLPVPYIDPGEVFAESVSPRSGVRLASMLVRRLSLDIAAQEILEGIPVTTVLQTLLDIARDYPLAFSVAVLDSAVRSSAVTVDELRSYSKSHPVRTGTRKIVRALENVDARRESVAESICAVRFVEYSVPGFEPQIEVRDENGKHLGRTDFANEGAKVIAEFDGAGKYYLDGSDPQETFERERRCGAARSGYGRCTIGATRLGLIGEVGRDGRLSRRLTVGLSAGRPWVIRRGVSRGRPFRAVHRSRERRSGYRGPLQECVPAV
jgi:hypothetical protein